MSAARSTVFPHSRFFWRALARRARLFRDHAQGNGALNAITDADRAMMRRALELASHAASLGEVPVGAVVYPTPSEASSAASTNGASLARDGAQGPSGIVAEGFNERERLRDPSAHAEFSAMTRAGAALGSWRLTGMTLAVTLEPCCMCAGLIVNARVDRVIYGARDPKAGAVESLLTLLSDRRLNHRPIVIPGLFAEESSSLLKEFFRERRAARRTDRRAAGS